MAAHTYTKFALALAQKKANLSSDALKVMLMSSYTPDRDAHEFVLDVLGAGTEASGTGYSAGGTALTSVTLTEVGHTYVLMCADPTWPASTITATFAVFYDSTPGSNATNPVMFYWDFGGAVSSAGTTFHLYVNPSGLAIFTAS